MSRSRDMLVLLVATLAVTLSGIACTTSEQRMVKSVDSVLTTIVHFPLPDTLIVGTLYSPTSYFLYREEPMGFGHDLVRQLSTDKGIPFRLEVATSLASAVEMLDSGKIHLLAYEVPVTAEYKGHVIPCGKETITNQVLVQPRDKGKLISDVTDLVGRDVYVEKGSKYQHRLINLNDELGGGIKIHAIDRDTLITEDLIAMVSEGDIPLTVVDSDIARLNKTYYNDLDITLEVSFPQRAAWGVSPEIPWLADTINAWSEQAQPSKVRAELLKRYFEMSKQEVNVFNFNFSGGRISRFDPLFKRYAREINWDWRLIAAQGFVESRYDSTQVSWAGAKGIMQIMPSTARAYGVTPDRMTNNDVSISTAVKILKELDKSLASKVPDRNERLKFTVAAYNSGLAHVLDAIALAGKYGLNPRVWDDNVEQAILMKTKPEYYNDPVCRYGYFRGRQTYQYVRSVFDFYNKAKAKIPI